MHAATRAILLTLLNKRYIGGRHTPEDKIVQQKIRYLSKEEKKIFGQEYKRLVNEQFLLREKKRTKGDYDWHISLNPKKLKQIYEAIT